VDWSWVQRAKRMYVKSERQTDQHEELLIATNVAQLENTTN